MVTARRDLGLEDPRIGHPIGYRGKGLGFLWLLSSDGPVREEHHDTIKRAAEDAALLIHREYLEAGLSRDRERELLGQLLSEVESEREAAAGDIVVEGLFTADSFAAMVVEIEGPGHQTSDEDQLALASGLEVIRGKRQSHHIVSLERRGHAVLIVAEPLGATARDELVALGGSLREAVLAKSNVEQCRVGIGRAYEDLRLARRSYDEARRTAHVCRQVRILDPVTPVESLGVYELLGQVSEDVLQSMLHPGLRELLEQSQTDSLVHTLEVFLDSAGDVKSASEQLFVHRTSLYYRLRRIQQLTGLDLSSGDDRLIAHLGLKIARLTGLS